jgi:hypothetical protein
MEQTELAQRCKEKGNKHFQSGKYQEALLKYKEALSIIDSQIIVSSDELKTSCLLNIAVSNSLLNSLEKYKLMYVKRL